MQRTADSVRGTPATSPATCKVGVAVIYVSGPAARAKLILLCAPHGVRFRGLGRTARPPGAILVAAEEFVKGHERRPVVALEVRVMQVVEVGPATGRRVPAITSGRAAAQLVSRQQPEGHSGRVALRLWNVRRTRRGPGVRSSCTRTASTAREPTRRAPTGFGARSRTRHPSRQRSSSKSSSTRRSTSRTCARRSSRRMTTLPAVRSTRS